MNTSKTFPGSLLGTAGILASLLMTAPAHAGLNWNGPVLQGPIFQGPMLQGPILQGPVLQGPVFQGISMQGISLNGRTATDAKVGRFVAVTLPSGETIPLR